MNNADMRGIFSALLVSYNEDGSINEKGLREIIRHNIDNMKVDGLYVGGSTGENFMISTEEKKRIFEIAKDEAKDQIKLIAQVGSINVYESVELAKFATALGYDAISAVTPFYYKFSFNEIKDYYNTIINSVNNRLIIYSIPFLTGVDMTVEQFGELFKPAGSQRNLWVSIANKDIFTADICIYGDIAVNQGVAVTVGG